LASSALEHVADDFTAWLSGALPVSRSTIAAAL
jgi:hypothetical protein